jgi:hypothetical protein
MPEGLKPKLQKGFDPLKDNIGNAILTGAYRPMVTMVHAETITAWPINSLL